MSQRDIRTLDQDAALEAYRAAACAEADAHFDDRALEAQRHKILDRLAHMGQQAKVIRFPKAGMPDVSAGAINRRWIRVAAAEGLIIGLLAASDDDGLLGEIELVMQARTANELRALDAFTLVDPY